MELTSHYQDSPPCPAYTVAASKHTSENQNKKTIPAFKSATLTKQTSPPPAPTYSNNFLRLGSIKKDALESLNLTQLININNKKIEAHLVQANPKENPGEAKPIQVRLVHQYPSKHLVVYTTTARQAKILRESSQEWLPQLTPNLTLHNAVHPVYMKFGCLSTQHAHLILKWSQKWIHTAWLLHDYLWDQSVTKLSNR